MPHPLVRPRVRALPARRPLPSLGGIAAALLLAAAPARLTAQVTTVDEGSFTVTRGGSTVGREEFRIVRQPAGGGTEFVARGLAAYGEQRIAPALQTDATGMPLRYQVEVRTGRAIDERLTGQLTRGHFTTQARTGSGEAAREYLLADSTVVLDDALYHQYYFVALRPRVDGRASVPVLIPRRNVQGRLRVQEAGTERLTLGARTLDATRLQVTDPGGRVHLVWVDEAGRVLRVTCAADGIVAQRDDPPR